MLLVVLRGRTQRRAGRTGSSSNDSSNSWRRRGGGIGGVSGQSRSGEPGQVPGTVA